MAAATVMAQCLPSEPTERVLRCCALSPQAVPIFPVFLPTTTELTPRTKLVLSGNILYGTAAEGGSSGNGTLFALHTDGSGFAVLHTFTATSSPPYTNSDGVYPVTGLALTGNTLYGTAMSGGSHGLGTIFAVHTDGTGFATLRHFTGSDGISPQSDLTITGDTIFGGARFGGRFGNGAVFAMNLDGTDFRTLHDFTATPIGPPYTNSDGKLPSGELIQSDGVVYGTARYGGSHSGNRDPNGNGTVFSISLPESPPQLSVITSGPNLILAWRTDHAGYDYYGYYLQSTTNLASPAWITNLPAPVVINGQYTVTNAISGNQQFFRLRK